MPYATNADLPPAVRKAYREHCQTVFRSAFNAAMDEYDDEGKAMATAHAAAHKCMSAKGMQPLKATVIDDDHFRLLAIPFGGPIPLPGAPKGVDLDAEWFSERTDIKPDWLPYRLVDWHHGHDDIMGRTVIAKADSLTEEDDGWWVDVWLQRGERRVDLVRKLAERGAQLYGSSESIVGMVRKATTGEILVWPYWRQTLTTSPQNTYSILRPLKAVIEDLATPDYTPSPSFWRELAASLDDLGTDLRATSGQSERGAKSGRVLSGANESALRDALDALGLSVTRLNEVLAKVRQQESP
jgi:cation transport regulator ChaB